MDDTPPNETTASNESTATNRTSGAAGNRSDFEPHVNPAYVESESTLTTTSRLLADQLSLTLNRSAYRLSRGETRRAERLLTDRYQTILGRYVTVAGATATEQDDQAAKFFIEGGTTQLEFVRGYARFQADYEAYQRAKSRGNSTRARLLARNLDDQSKTIKKQSDTLSKTYSNASLLAKTDLNTTTDLIENMSGSVSERERTVESTEFVQTRLSVTPNGRTTAYNRPLSLSGQIRTANGTALANRTITVAIENQTTKVETNESGWFTTTFRPKRVPLNASTVTVQYVPSNTSVFLGTTETVGVRIVQSPARVSITESPETVRFGDNLTISGSVQADGRGVSEVPVVVSADGQVVGRNLTGTEGNFSVRTNVGPGISDGNVSVRATLPFRGRALKATTATEAVRVDPSETVLDLDVRGREDVLQVRGRLQTTRGRAVPSQPVTLRVENRTLRRVETDETGNFRLNFTFPPGNLTNEQVGSSIEIRAIYDGEGTNLDQATANSVIELSGAGGSGSGVGSGLAGFAEPSPGDSPRALLKQVQVWFLNTTGESIVWPVVLLLTGCLGGLAIVRQFNRRAQSSRIRVDSASDGFDESTETDLETVGESVIQALDDSQGQTHKEFQDPDEVTEAVYMAIRNWLARRYDIADTETHWEFYRSCRDQEIDDSKIAALESLTRTYEHAKYAPEGAHPDAVADIRQTVSAFDIKLPDIREDQ